MSRLLLLLPLLACGKDDPAGKDKTTEPDPTLQVCEPSGVPGAPLRLLTTTEIDRSVGDLLAVDGASGGRLPADPTVHGFEGFAETVGVSQLQADGYMRASEDVTDQIDWTALLPCDVATGDSSCAEAFIADFGGRAFRRPLTTEESGIFVDLFTDMDADQGFEIAMASVVQAMLQSPQFLYRIELGDPSVDEPIVPLTSHELATRLSYLLWASTPDDTLLAAAGDDSLRDPTVLAEQVDRMLADPKARDVIGRFVEQWTGITELEDATKDALNFPTWTPDLADDLVEETRRYSAHVVFDGEGTLEALLTSPTTIANRAVADHYGVSGPTSDDEWVEISLPADQRAGLLTHASLLATAAHNNQTSPVHRGLFVYEQLFCGIQPQPPDDLDITLPPLDDSISTRERFARHTQDPLCADCHSFMDPIGFGFEHYDPTGAWRDTEGDGIPVDSSGILTYSSQQGLFDGAIELSAKTAAAPEVRECFVTQWFRASNGRDPGDADLCTLEELDAAFASGDVIELLRAIPQTESFRTRPKVTP